MNQHSEAVARGKAALDAYDPEWVGKVDWDALYMSNAARCILGQLFGELAREAEAASGFAHGMDVLGLIEEEGGCCKYCDTWDASQHYGFSTMLVQPEGEYYTDWDGLASAWRAAVGKQPVSQ